MTFKVRRIARCRHTHVSGRRCGSPEGDRTLHLCRYHVTHSDNCSECMSMKQSFIPPKGW